MKHKLFLAAVAAAATLTVASPAMARDGCGRDFHRGPAGHCRPNVGRGAVIGGPRIVIGNFYQGRGYWDGRRYWQQRYRHHNGWRYR